MILAATSTAWLIFGVATIDGVSQHVTMSKHSTWAWCNSRRADTVKLLHTPEHIAERERLGLIISIEPDCLSKKPGAWLEKSR